MTLPRLAGGVGRLAPVGIALLGLAGTARAQSEASSTATVVRLPGGVSDSLPVDSLEQALGFFPGIGINDGGRLILRGGLAGGEAAYLDGVPVSPGYRRAGQRLGSHGAHLLLGTNGFAATDVILGVPAARYGNAESGILSYQALEPATRLTGRLRYATDEVIGTQYGLGVNRVEAAMSGPVGDRFRFAVTGVVTGHRSAEAGPGSEKSPIFIGAGVDTTFRVPTVPFDPFSDTVSVNVQRFAAFRGECGRFAGSVLPGIAANYGVDCAGIRSPGAAVSNGEASAVMAYRIDGRHEVRVTAALSQLQRRIFDYVTLNLPQQATGDRSTSRVVTLDVHRRHGGAVGAVGWRAAVSFQLDQDERGPLTPQSAADSWYPWGGFLIAPLDLAFGLGRFAVDEALVDNYRLNRAGSRRSPYDLENVDQYSLTSRFRANAYALAGFPDGGGPDGRLAMSRERRTVAVGDITWRASSRHLLTGGGEVVGYRLSNYSHDLTSQALSDVYIESPKRLAFYLEDRVDLGDVTLSAGLCYDRFTSGADRTFLLDLSPASATFNDYVPFPRPASYQGMAPDGRPLGITQEDGAHGALSPRMQIGASLSPGTIVFASAGRMAQLPDFSELYAGVNTDFSITTADQRYGEDLGFVRVNVAEVGMRRRLGTAEVSGAVYLKDWDNLTRVQAVDRWDPLNGRTSTILAYTDDDSRTVRGFDVRLDMPIGGWVRGTASYSFAHAESSTGETVADVRPHAVTALVFASAPAGWKRGTTLGGVVDRLGATVIMRFASGTAYSSCPGVAGPSVLSDEACGGPFPQSALDARLPTVKEVDLRLTKGLSVGGADVSIFLDARNLLNFDRTQRVFAHTGTTESEAARLNARAVAMTSYQSEGARNGVQRSDGSLDLSAVAGNCVDWVDPAGAPAAPNCVYLIRAEQRFGNGDGIFDEEEQALAADASYQNQFGRHTFLGAPRRVRVGFTIGL